jgi:hypothetical protein
MKTATRSAGSGAPRWMSPKRHIFRIPLAPTASPSSDRSVSKEQFEKAALQKLYKDHADYVTQFEHRLDELVRAGWFLAEDAEEFRVQAQEADVP